MPGFFLSWGGGIGYHRAPWAGMPGFYLSGWGRAGGWSEDTWAPPQSSFDPCSPFQMTFQQICKDVHMVKNKGQQVFIESRTKPQAAKAPCAGECLGMPQQRKGSRPRHHGPSSEPCPLPCAAGLDVALERGVLGREALREPERSPACAPTSEGSVRKEPSNYSYQQINCLDGIIR